MPGRRYELPPEDGKRWYTWGMVTVRREDIESELTNVLARVERGETVLILRGEEPFAEVRPVPTRQSGLRPFGLAAGQFIVPDDFDTPLASDVLALFERE